MLLSPRLRGCVAFLCLFLALTGTRCHAQQEKEISNSTDWYARGKTLYNEKKYKESISAFEQAELAAARSQDTVRLMNALSWLGLSHIAIEDYLTSKKYYQEALQRELQYGDSTRIAKAFNNLGISQYYLSELDSCLINYHQALDIYRLIGNQALPQFIKNIGLVYQKQGQYENAAQYLFESALMFEQKDDKAEAASVYNIIGNMYNESGYDSLSVHYHSLGLRLRRSLNDKMAIAQSLNNLANAGRKIFGVDSALYLYREALAITDEFDRKRLRSALLNNIGEIYLNRGNLKESRTFFDQSLELKKYLNDQYGIAHTIHNLARISLLEENMDEAEVYILEGLPKTEKIGASKLLLKYYGLYAYFLTSEKRFEEATRYYPKYVSLKDSLLNDMKLQAFSEAEVKYRTAKLKEEVAFLRPMEQEIEVLTLQMENQQVQLNFQRAINWGTGIGAAMMLVLVILARRDSLQRKRFNELLALKNTEIEHRVKNNLGILMAIFSGQSRMTSDDKLKTILRQNEYRIKTIRHLHNLLSKESIGEVSSRIYFEGLIDDLLFSLDLPKKHCIISIGNISLDADKMLHVGLLLNELITNAVKHGLSQVSNPCLEVSLQDEGNSIQLRVKDNGPGMKNSLEQNPKTSYGMSLINKLVNRQLEGSLDYHDDHGAVFSIKIPI